MKSFFRLFAFSLLLLVCTSSRGQGTGSGKPEPASKPYKVQTSGRQITIKSSKPVYHVMIWTTDGNRVVEQKEINSNSFTATVPVSRKAFFLMVGLNNGKVYTEKIGIP